MDKIFEFHGSLNFRDSVEMYRRIICTGFKIFSNYELFAQNYEKGIIFVWDNHFDEEDYLISVSEDNKEKGIVEKLQKSVANLTKDIEDIHSDNIFVANSPLIRFKKEFFSRDIESIAREEVDRIGVTKDAKFIYLFGYSTDKQFPFVNERDLSVNKMAAGLYKIRLIADTSKEIDTVEKLFYEIVSSSIK